VTGQVSVDTRGAPFESVERSTADELIAAGVPAALAGKDPTLWGTAATSEASVRLGWLDCADRSRELVGPLAKLREELVEDGLDHVVLAGMGGSSLAPEVISRTFGTGLTVLDTTDPGQVLRALRDRLDRTVVVVSSKSGGTVETDSHRRVYEQAFRDAGCSPADADRRFVVVTDPGSPLAELAGSYRATFFADPDVGGRYSALTAFGLVPSALTGVDVVRLLDEAAAVQPALGRDTDNPGLALGAALGGPALSGRDKVVLSDTGSGIVGFGDWAEQLLAESTGKDGRGLLPVVLESADAPGGAETAGAHPVRLGPADGRPGTAVAGPLGAMFLVWEYATAVAGRILGINPFDQPNVQESKDNTRAALERGATEEDEPLFDTGSVRVFADPDLVPSRSLSGLLRSLVDAVPATGYLAVQAYLDRLGDTPITRLRPALARRTSAPVTFGWGPRFLHSTGQYHKGGPPTGVFLQITGGVREDLAIPGRPYTFGRLQLAQAAGDRQALAGRGRPVVRLHLTNRADGIGELVTAAEAWT
jgi:glucose-6-phosphate isomerase